MGFGLACAALASHAFPREAFAQKPVNVLKLPRGVGVATIKSAEGGVFLLQGNKFSRVATGDALVVLNRPRNGIIARLVVKELLLNGDVKAELETSGGGVSAKALLDAPVLHERDALNVREQLAKGPVKLSEGGASGATGSSGAPTAGAPLEKAPTASNPTLLLAASASWEEKNGVVYLLATPVDASQRVTRLHAQAYAPWSPALAWTNWFGVELEAQWEDSWKTTFGTTSEGAATGDTGGYALEATTSALAVGVGFRPVFSSTLLSRAGVVVHVVDRSTESIRLSGGPRQEVTEATLQRAGLSVEAQVESNPGGLGLFGVRYRKPLSQKVRVVEKAPAGEVTSEGTTQGQSLAFEAGLRLPVFQREATPTSAAKGVLAWEAKAVLEMRSETLNTGAFDGERQFTNQAFRLQTGVSWTP